MKTEMDENKPTAKEMNLPEEFVYATRIVNTLSKIDFSKPCDIEEAVKMVTKVFVEYEEKIKNDLPEGWYKPAVPGPGPVALSDLPNVKW
jgi:hypothetical protein